MSCARASGTAPFYSSQYRSQYGSQYGNRHSKRSRRGLVAPYPARLALAAAALALLAGCAGKPMQRDGPPDKPPAQLILTPDAVPRVEPLRSGGPNKPYEVFGQRYVPHTTDVALDENGGASWYGRKFHGLPTSSGEPYDMYAMTAAHRTMPIPSYARVRNPANGREIVVRINDRGPFAAGRVIDLSYVAALKLGVLGGVAPVQVHRLTQREIRSLQLQDRDRAQPQPQLRRPDLPADLQPEP